MRPLYYCGGVLHPRPSETSATTAVGMEGRTRGDGSAPRLLNILLVGARRTGKSCAGNTLLGRGPVFDTGGGGASAAASGTAAGRRLTVVDARGWGLSEDVVPKEDTVDLLRAMSLFGLEGPHVVLLVIPVLDFTEAERSAVERRMEVLTSGVWRHTMVLFTCGDRLKRRGGSIEEHIQSAGPALRRLMEKCRYRYHVFDNKAAGERNKANRGPAAGLARRGEIAKGLWWGNKGGETDGREEGAQEQVRELLVKVEDMLQENGGWHFSLHMYRRMEEEWSRRELEPRGRRVPETEGGHRKGGQTAAEPGNAAEQRRASATEEGEQATKASSREEEQHVWGENEGNVKVELRRREDEYGSTGTKASPAAPRWLLTGPGLEFDPIRKLA